jgi:hypothetical protein
MERGTNPFSSGEEPDPAPEPGGPMTYFLAKLDHGAQIDRHGRKGRVRTMIGSLFVTRRFAKTMTGAGLLAALGLFGFVINELCDVPSRPIVTASLRPPLSSARTVIKPPAPSAIARPETGSFGPARSSPEPIREPVPHAGTLTAAGKEPVSPSPELKAADRERTQVVSHHRRAEPPPADLGDPVALHAAGPAVPLRGAALQRALAADRLLTRAANQAQPPRSPTTLVPR